MYARNGKWELMIPLCFAVSSFSDWQVFNLLFPWLVQSNFPVVSRALVIVGAEWVLSTHIFFQSLNLQPQILREIHLEALIFTKIQACFM